MLRYFRQQKELDALRQELDGLKRLVNGLELEWSDMHDRLRRMLAKISKREERARALEDTQPVGEGDGTESLSTLSPRQRVIQEQLAAIRKARGGE